MLSYLDVNCSALRLYEMDGQGLPCKLRHSPLQGSEQRGMWLGSNHVARGFETLECAVSGRSRPSQSQRPTVNSLFTICYATCMNEHVNKDLHRDEQTSEQASSVDGT